MTTYRCPDGHVSGADDYCDVCGLPIPAPGASPAAAAGGSLLDLGPAAPAGGTAPPALTPATKPCPNCGVDDPADALFCEDCGYDFTTGTAPPPAPPPPTGDMVITPSAPPAPRVPVEWVAEVWVDPDWYADQDSDDPCPSAGTPAIIPLHERSVLVGRHSASRNIHPQIDCAADSGVSRRHAQFTSDGQRWWVEDLQSSNGTFTGRAGAPLPTDPMTPGQRRELAGDDRVYVGAWTRIVIRRATPDEKGN